MNPTGFLTVLAYLASTLAANHKVVEQMSISAYNTPSNDDFGIANNCGQSVVSAKWSPKVVSTQGQITAYANLTAPFDMTGGFGEVDIYNHADGSLIAQYGSPFNCGDITKWIQCPLTKNRHF